MLPMNGLSCDDKYNQFIKWSSGVVVVSFWEYNKPNN